MESFSSLEHKPRSDNVFVKVLIPSNCGGVVIGKGGQAVVKAQEESGATVKISKVGEYFPETNERICLIHGDQASINRMIDYISTCISDKSDIKTFSRLDRQKQTILVIPNSSAGLLIGREGETISTIKKESGAFIQVSPKTFNQIGGERCVMISGNSEQRSKASRMILDKIIDDPKLCSFPNLVYNGDGSNSFAGSGYSNSSSGMNMVSPNYDSNNYEKYHYPIGLSHFNEADGRSPNPNSGNYSSNTALSPSSFNSMPSSRMNNMAYDDYSPGSNSQMFYKISSKPQNSSQTFQQMDFIASNSVNGITRTIDVDEDYIGAIIGPRGSAILELQEITNTSIKVSKKPDALGAGTVYNGKRTVSIYGFYHEVSRAYLLICDKIKNEQNRRDNTVHNTSTMSNNSGSNNNSSSNTSAMNIDGSSKDGAGLNNSNGSNSNANNGNRVN